MPRIKAILVDDEESARDVLQNLLSRFCPEVELVAKCSTVLEAVKSINIIQPDLIFLDIEMPNYAGYELVNFFPKVDFEIIFVTAYDKYAIRAFELAAIDYLLKPVDIERLKQAVARVRQHFDVNLQAERMALLSQTMQQEEVKNLIVNDRGQQHVVALGNIVAIEAQESYCLLHTGLKKFIVSRNLKHYETVLEDCPDFLRVHKSWVVNKQHILHYSKSELQISLTGGVLAKLSKYQKLEFEAAIKR